MTTNYLRLDAVAHEQTRVLDDKLASAFANIGNCNIIFDEIFSASGCFPLFLIKDPETGAFNLSAIFGLKNNQNLFVDGSQWTAPYCPLNLKRLPFAISAQPTEGEDVYDIYIDADSELLSSSAGARIFDDNGEETALLKDRQRILTAIVQDPQSVTKFIEALLKYDLVSPMNITLKTVAGPETVSGLYAIDHVKMQNMDRDTYAKLADKNLLEAVFMMKASYAQINRLVWLENQSTANNILSYSMSPVASDII